MEALQEATFEVRKAALQAAEEYGAGDSDLPSLIPDKVVKAAKEKDTEEEAKDTEEEQQEVDDSFWVGLEKKGEEETKKGGGEEEHD